MSPKSRVRGIFNDVEADAAELYEKFADELTRFATGLVGPSEAQDVVSESVIRCLFSPAFRRATNSRAYLYRSVLNEARSVRRSAQRRRQRERSAAQVSVATFEDVQPEVLAAISRLSVRQRAVIFLTYWNDYSPASIANLLGINEGTVRRHLARARANLRGYLDGSA